jgi:manganese-dependent inorganic pyrophosphatase
MPIHYPIHITGHKHPDTDSICSAIAYTHLKRKLGFDAIACRLGETNHETNYVLKRFNFEHPVILDDARMRLNEIDIDTAVTITEETTIYEAWQFMSLEKKVLCVVDEHNVLLGVLTNSNLSSVAMGDTAKSIELLSKTPIEYIAKTISGALIYAPKVTRLNGKVSIVAVAEHKLDNYELKDRTVIIGNDTEAMMQAIEKDAACLVIVWADFVRDEVIKFAKEKGCAIILSGHGTLNTSRYIFYSSPIKFIMSTELITFDKSEFVDDALNKVVKSRFRSYPVVDDKGKIFGLISRYHLLNARRKQIILVDHNETAQSVDGLMEADLIEVVDHHRIGDIQTSKPINFRNQLVGSTCTIIANLYDENRVPMDKDMAGLLCAAILSDTLNFKSPTTTLTDIHTAQRCARVAELNTDALAKDIFTEGAGLHEKSALEIIENDIKEFQVGNYRIRVGQMSLFDVNQVDSVREDIVKAMKSYVEEKRIDLLLLLFTSLEHHGSAMLYMGKEKWIAEEAYPGIDNKKLSLFANVLSRKKQVMPRISSIVEGRTSL